MAKRRVTPRKAPAAQRPALWRRPAFTCAALAFVTAAIYSRACFNEFVNIDDSFYAADNSRVQNGLTGENIRWGLTSLEHANWHPLTWLSLQLDATLFGKSAAGFHATNVVLHVANTVLLFWVLQRATGALPASGVTAALFALHPLHVESVAWVSERKDLLSALFWLLTMLAYDRYANDRYANDRYANERYTSGRYANWRSGWYTATILFFAIGLAAKPMLVTLPFVLLLWDVWPLRQLRLNDPSGGKDLLGASGQTEIAQERRAESRLGLVLEKIPLLLLSGLSCVITVAAQQRMGAMRPLDKLSIGERLQHVPLAYVEYLSKTFFPRNLAAFYPYIYLSHAVGPLVLSTLCLVMVTLWAFRRLRRQPYLMVGWMWYLGTLVPVIGLVQVGGQAIADRYTYIPLIGVFIALVWAAGDLVRRWNVHRGLVAVAAGVALILLGSLTWKQIGYWYDSITLWQHAAAVSPQNPKIYASIGSALLDKQRYEEARQYLQAALSAGQDDGSAHADLGVALFNLGQFRESEEEFDRALRLNADNDKALYNLGCARLVLKDTAGAMTAFEEALKKNPYQWRAHLALAETLAIHGAAEDAQAHFQRALEIDRQGSLDSWQKAHPNAADAAALAEQTADRAPHSAE
ncbi:MAG TPA: tetratricopeptide repeat protein [Pirellulales bacterium]|nr:tetratricopeptide repeat protein [Pirellulales bacterium]